MTQSEPPRGDTPDGPATESAAAARSQPETGPQPHSGPKPQVGLVVFAVFSAFLAQMTMIPVIAPLARGVGLSELQMGTVIGVAALALVLTSSFWGRHSQSWGRKPVLIAALSVGLLASAAFFVLALLGMRAELTGMLLFGGMIVTRGVLFGGSLSAMAPTAQAYVANVTTTEQDRVNGMSAVGAAQGMAMIGGAVIGGALAGLGILVPLLAMPVMLGIGLIAVVFGLRPEPRTELITKPIQVSPFDHRVLPFLLVGLGMFTAMGFVQVLIGFFIADRQQFSPELTSVATGGSLLAAGIGMILAQAVIVPRSGWPPRKLLIIGTCLAAVGLALMTPDLGLVTFLIASIVTGLGIGVAMPGFSAGPSLLVDRAEQGGVAGLVTATMGVSFVLAPILGTGLYSIWHPLPLILAAALMGGTAVFAALNPVVRRASSVASAKAAGISDAA